MASERQQFKIAKYNFDSQNVLSLEWRLGMVPYFLHRKQALQIDGLRKSYKETFELRYRPLFSYLSTFIALARLAVCESKTANKVNNMLKLL